jgi:penicillin amidase
MARVVTPGLTWAGATAPGLPFLVIGSNGHLAWGFTTTHGDTQDLFEEKLLADPAGHYLTPTGPAALAIRREIIKVAGGADVALDVRLTRHGPLISDLDPERYLHRHFSLAWAGFWSDDRTPEAFLRMNHAQDAASFREALRDFHTPEQNVVFADTKGNIGFVAAGRVPVRQVKANLSILPVAGWTADNAWLSSVSFEELPQLDNPLDGRIVTANNDIRPPGYNHFIGYSFDRPYRRDRIAALLEPLSKATVADMQRIQLDTLSSPVLGFVKAHLPDVAGSIPLDVAAKMAGWDGRMDADRPEPLIAIAWLHATAQRVLADDLGEDFDAWWFWQTDVLDAVMRDGRWCDDAGTTATENCRDMLRRAMADALDRLHDAHGADWRTWRWGTAHRMYYRHPVFARIPYLGDYLVPSVPAFGDQFTISRAGMAIEDDGAAFPDVHGPGMRMVIDLSRPAALSFNLAGGQSGHPLSPHYSDLLLEWASGSYRTFQAPAEDILTLRPAH